MKIYTKPDSVRAECQVNGFIFCVECPVYDWAYDRMESASQVQERYVQEAVHRLSTIVANYFRNQVLEMPRVRANA